MVLLGRTRRLVAVGGMASHDGLFGEFIESVEDRDQQRPDATFASSSCPRVSTLTATPPQECPNRVVAVSKICKKARGWFSWPRLSREGVLHKVFLCKGLRPIQGGRCPSPEAASSTLRKRSCPRMGMASARWHGAQTRPNGPLKRSILVRGLGVRLRREISEGIAGSGTSRLRSRSRSRFQMGG